MYGEFFGSGSHEKGPTTRRPTLKNILCLWLSSDIIGDNRWSKFGASKRMIKIWSIKKNG
jgi:hypothetical protein